MSRVATARTHAKALAQHGAQHNETLDTFEHNRVAPARVAQCELVNPMLEGQAIIGWQSAILSMRGQGKPYTKTGATEGVRTIYF